MKIAVYKDSLATGRGADRAVRNFAAGLAERGHDVTLFEKGGLAKRLDESWDVIVATGSNEIVDLNRAGYFEHSQRSRVILQLHLAPRGFFKWKHPFRNRAIRKAFDRADAVQLLCKSYEPEFKALAMHPQVTTIGNYTEMPRPDCPHDADSRIILYPAAALNAVKNQQLLIRAFATLASAFPEWRVRLLGKTTTGYAEKCRRLVSRLRLDDRIDFVGFTNDLAGEYSRAAFIAFPSTLEGFPLALLEAAQFGLPAVVQQALPGASDIVTPETGIVTEPTVKSYAAGLRRLMADAELREKMGAAAKSYCAEHYSREKILDQWEMLLAQACRNYTLIPIFS